MQLKLQKRKFEKHKIRKRKENLPFWEGFPFLPLPFLANSVFGSSPTRQPLSSSLFSTADSQDPPVRVLFFPLFLLCFPSRRIDLIDSVPSWLPRALAQAALHHGPPAAAPRPILEASFPRD